MSKRQGGNSPTGVPSKHSDVLADIPRHGAPASRAGEGGGGGAGEGGERKGGGCDIWSCLENVLAFLQEDEAIPTHGRVQKGCEIIPLLSLAQLSGLVRARFQTAMTSVMVYEKRLPPGHVAGGGERDALAAGRLLDLPESRLAASTTAGEVWTKIRTARVWGQTRLFGTFASYPVFGPRRETPPEPLPREDVPQRSRNSQNRSQYATSPPKGMAFR